MNDDCSNLSSISQTDMLPGFSTIDGLINSFSGNYITTQPIRTGRSIDNIRIYLIHSQCSDRRRFEKAIGNIVPRGAIISRFPDATASGAQIKGARLYPSSGNSGYPTTTERTDISKFEIELTKASMHCHYHGGKKKHSIFIHYLFFLRGYFYW